MNVSQGTFLKEYIMMAIQTPTGLNASNYTYGNFTSEFLEEDIDWSQYIIWPDDCPDCNVSATNSSPWLIWISCNTSATNYSFFGFTFSKFHIRT